MGDWLLAILYMLSFTFGLAVGYSVGWWRGFRTCVDTVHDVLDRIIKNAKEGGG